MILVVLTLDEVDVVLEDIVSLSSPFESIMWCHVRREGNTVARPLARVCRVWRNYVESRVFRRNYFMK